MGGRVMSSFILMQFHEFFIMVAFGCLPNINLGRISIKVKNPQRQKIFFPFNDITIVLVHFVAIYANRSLFSSHGRTTEHAQFYLLCAILK